MAPRVASWATSATRVTFWAISPEPLAASTRLRVISAVVASDIIARVAGKRLATTVGRRVPVVGGVVGAGADGYATWKIGRYADRELLPRTR